MTKVSYVHTNIFKHTLAVNLLVWGIRKFFKNFEKLRAATTKGKKRQQPQQKLQLQPQLQQRLQQRRSSPSFYIAATASAAVGVAVGVAVDVEHRRIPHRKLRKLH